ncbi:Hydroxymethylglutaryl-CoA lyase yngG [Moraxella cuniculi]|uniref:Hydroxymethylglutaryl-CoA lyase yngG n=1 Tax=Moraxella cuniculi TaxID=34061 RepID=A0A3S4R6I3_9GAMM|nr:Hydroxymethylglutaryl-CoA lyase yngG [Moraxella cuniculi]
MKVLPKNINCSINDSLLKFQEILKLAKTDGVRVRGYISCMTDCPYEGKISSVAVAEIYAKLIDMGRYEISLGETLGTATPD